MAKTADPRRLRWSVPAADLSTNRWLDEQADISLSVRVLIRESIQRDGYIDVYNKPVEQLPRRSRPPHSESGEQGRSPQEESTGLVEPETGDMLTPDAHRVDTAGVQHDRVIERAAPGADGSAKSSAGAAAPGQPVDEPAAEPQAPVDEPAAPEPEPGPVKAPRKQSSIDEIMASTRR